MGTNWVREVKNSIRELLKTYDQGPWQNPTEEEIAAFEKKHADILVATYREATEIGAECFLELMDNSPYLAAKIYKSVLVSYGDEVINDPIMLIATMTQISKNLV